MQVITTESVPIKLWLNDIEPSALVQAKALANLPFVYKHIAIMPDSHCGYGMPIGGVMATNDVVVPNAVGVDIGCGMCAFKTNITYLSTLDLKEIMGHIRECIPVGFNHHKERQKWEGFDKYPEVDIIKQEINKAQYQLGTLGGGNHFIEIQKGSDGFIWIMLHSGSRNFGLKIANDYHKKAVELCERWYSDIPNKDLSFLPCESKEAKEYWEAMNFALEFAKENRLRMMSKIIAILNGFVNVEMQSAPIDIHHNYAKRENHFGKSVIIHRKGATLAQEGTIGIIPGSQGTKSYIVRGLGNKESFNSCSHGAGRRMGRGQATRELNLEDEQKKLNDKGIIHSVRNVADLDEASGAYKDISVVMENQKDLVEIVTELTPLAVIKG